MATYTGKFLKNIKILYVEDNEDDVTLLVEKLNDVLYCKYTLKHMTHFNQAISMLEQEHFDVVLLDLSLPDSQGIETFNQMHSRFPKLPIVVLSGTDDEIFSMQTIQSGAQDYLVKGQGSGHVIMRSIRYAMERKQIEEALRVAKEEAEYANQSKSLFLANISHEIRTPLNSVVSIGQLMLQTDLDPKQQDYIHKLQSSAHHLLEIINDILDFSKIEAGKLILEPILFNLDDLIDSIASISHIKVADKQIENTITVHENVPRALIGDQLRLKQVLINLLSNAIKFTHQGEVELTVEMLEQQDDDLTLLFSVTDTGIGIAKEKHDVLFHSFSQLDGSITRKYGGTGLGLSICKHMVMMMGGDISVESRLNVGSKFAFTIKLKQQFNQDASLILPLTIRNKKILIFGGIPKSEDNIKSVLRSLSLSAMARHEFAAAKDLNTQFFDIVIIDQRRLDTDASVLNELNNLANADNLFYVVLVNGIALELTDQILVGKNIHLMSKPVTRLSMFRMMMGLYGKKIPEFQLFSQSDDNPIQGASILLVEDHHINQKIVREILINMGLQIDVANDGQEAVALCAENYHYDAVLMDLQMPNMDGYQTTKIIRQTKQAYELPIIALTANIMTDEKNKCIKVGMNDFITKPVDVEQLFAKLVKWINKKKPATEAAVKAFPGIDKASAMARLNDNEPLYQQLLQTFKKDYGEIVKIMDSDFLVGEYKQVQEKNHLLKGIAGNLSLDRIYQASIALDQCFKQNEKERVGVLLDELNEAMDSTLVSIQLYCR